MEYILLLSAPLIGLLVGLLPTLGATITMLLLYPILQQFDFVYIILFYAIMINASQFSGSVSAISFNILGEVSSAPVLKERPLIIKDNLHMNALRNTMYGSLFGMFFGMLILIFTIATVSNYTFLLRSDVAAFFLLVAAFFLLLWNKSYMTNAILITIGYTIGLIGYDRINGDILTFGNSYLSGGIPTMSFLFGLYMIPRLYRMMHETKVNQPQLGQLKLIKYKINFFSMLRGGVIGGVLGLVPFIGTLINSNLAYNLENFFHKKNNGEDSLKRITSAETANNTGQVTVLIPLLVLGIAIQPSEIILLELLESKFWSVSQTHNWNFLILLYTLLPIGCLLTAFFCYNIVRKVLQFFYNYIQIILYIILFTSAVSILYAGYEADQTVYYFIVLFASTVIGLFLEKKKIDVLPLIIMFLLENNYSDMVKRAIMLYLG
jgi:putative tricarboxylic transport membrane protein